MLPATPNLVFAQEVVSAFDREGYLNATPAESAQEIVTTANPTYDQYYSLAYLAYAAHDYARGDLAAAKAVALAPKEREDLDEGGPGAGQAGERRCDLGDRHDRGHLHDGLHRRDLEHRRDRGAPPRRARRAATGSAGKKKS